MPLSLPTNPVDYQVHSENGRTWVWIPDGTPRWQICKEPPVSHKSSHATGGTDALTPADIGAASVESLNSLAAQVASLSPEESRAWMFGSNGNNTFLGYLRTNDFPSSGSIYDSPAWEIFRTVFNSSMTSFTEASATGAWSNRESLIYS